MSKEQMKNARTGTSVYDLVNGLTNFGSTDYGFKISDYDQRKLQLEAGRLLTKKFDMANQVKSPFEQITSHFGTAYEATN
jgi:hypothetical protein